MNNGSSKEKLLFNKRTELISPLRPLRFLYKFYSYLSVFPANINPDCTEFTRTWTRYLPAFVINGLIFSLVMLDNNPWDQHTGFIEEMINLYGKGRQNETTFTSLDKVLGHSSLGSFYLLFCCFFFLGHIKLKDFNTLFNANTMAANSVSMRPILRHHCIILTISTIESVGQSIAPVLQLQHMLWEARLICSTIAIIVFKLWVNMVIALPEVTITAFLHSMTQELEGQTNDAKKSMKTLLRLRRGFDQMGQFFGAHVILIIGLSLGNLIFGLYFLVGMLGISSFGLWVLPKALMIVVYTANICLGLKRLFHLTSHVQKFLDAKNKAVHELMSSSLKAENDAQLILEVT